MTTTSHSHDSSSAGQTGGNLLAGGWRQLSDHVSRAMCTLRAINDLRHQTELVFPGHFSQGKSRAWLDAPDGAEIIRLPVQTKPGDTAQTQFMAMLVADAFQADGTIHPQPHQCPTALLFYSSEQNLAAVAPQIEQLRHLGMNVACPEYLGYGMSSGEPSEKAFHAAAETALRHLLDHPSSDANRIILIGCGIGGAVATELASRHDVAGLVLLSAMTSMYDLLAHRLPDRTVQMLVRQRFDAAARLKDVKCPILIGHGGDDPVIPVEMAEQLASVARSVVRRVLIDGSSRHGVQLIDEDALHRPLAKFIEDLRPRRVASEGRAPSMMLRPIPMKMADRPVNLPRTAAIDPPIPALVPTGAFPAQFPMNRYPRPASRAS